jgi:hypothetical protein
VLFDVCADEGIVDVCAAEELEVGSSEGLDVKLWLADAVASGEGAEPFSALRAIPATTTTDPRITDAVARRVFGFISGRFIHNHSRYN